MGAKTAACLALGFLENILFAGVIFGWPNLVVILSGDGLFCDEKDLAKGNNSLAPSAGGNVDIDLSSNSSSSPIYSYDVQQGPGNASGNGSLLQNPLVQATACTAVRDFHFTLCYTLCGLTFQLASFPTGMLFDKFGFRVAKLSGSAFFIVGCVLLAFAGPGLLSYLIYPGMSILAISCCHSIITNQHLPALAGDSQATVTTLYSGAIDSSIIVFLIFKLLYENVGISRKISFLVYAGVWVGVTSFNTFLFAPKYKCPTSEAPDTVKETEMVPMKTDTDDNKDNKKALDGSTAKNNNALLEKANQENKELSFVGCLKTALFWLHLFWFALIQLRFYVYLVGLAPWLSKGAGGDKERVSQYLTWFGYISLGGILSAPLAGAITDAVRRRGLGMQTDNKMLGTAMTLAPSIFVGSILAILHSILMLAWHDVVVYFTFVFFVMFRSFLFGNLYAFLGMVFPGKQFGKLYGIYMILSGAVSFLQFPIIIWTETIESFLPCNILMLALVSLTIIHPLYIAISYRKDKTN